MTIIRRLEYRKSQLLVAITIGRAAVFVGLTKYFSIEEGYTGGATLL